MKRILLTLIILSSCSKDNNNPAISIEGSWTRTNIGESVGVAMFKSGKGEFYRNNELQFTVTYKQDGDKVTMTPNYNDEKYVYKITQSSDEVMLRGISNNFTLGTMSNIINLKRK